MNDQSPCRLDPEQIENLLKLCLKPDEIAVGSKAREDRITELLFWFLRYSRKEANPKWADAHSYELAYYIATGSHCAQGIEASTPEPSSAKSTAESPTPLGVAPKTAAHLGKAPALSEEKPLLDRISIEALNICAKPTHNGDVTWDMAEVQITERALRHASQHGYLSSKPGKEGSRDLVGLIEAGENILADLNLFVRKYGDGQDAMYADTLRKYWDAAKAKAASSSRPK